MALIEAIGRGPLALDSVVFIYFIERHPRYVSLLRSLFQSLDRNEIPAVTSALTLLETLVVPYRTQNYILAAQYEAILRNSGGLQLIPIDPPLLRLAAEIRARTAARVGDALQLAAARVANCTALLTNDRRLPTLAGIEILQLDAFA